MCVCVCVFSVSLCLKTHLNKAHEYGSRIQQTKNVPNAFIRVCEKLMIRQCICLSILMKWNKGDEFPLTEYTHIQPHYPLAGACARAPFNLLESK